MARKPIKAQSGPKKPTARKSFPIEKQRVDRNPKLKTLVAELKKSHSKYCDLLKRTTYQIWQKGAETGDLILLIMKEGAFKSKRKVHIWLEFQCGTAIPQATFYHYVELAENRNKVETIHGTEMLTNITTAQFLKRVANSMVDVEPQDDGWEEKDGDYHKGCWFVKEDEHGKWHYGKDGKALGVMESFAQVKGKVEEIERSEQTTTFSHSAAQKNGQDGTDEASKKKWEREVAKAEADAGANVENAREAPIGPYSKVYETLSAISTQILALTIPTGVTAKQHKALHGLLDIIIVKTSALLHNMDNGNRSPK